MRLMLPTSRIIGHKDYAKGRKSDPTYDMNWRRNRVATFAPRQGAAAAGGPFMALSDAQQNDLLKMVGALHYVLVSAKAGAAGEVQDMVRNIHGAVAGVFDYKPHHGAAKDNLLGHVLSVRKEVAGDQAAPALPVNLDAAEVAAALAADSGFVDDIAEATARKIAARLQE